MPPRRKSKKAGGANQFHKCVLCKQNFKTKSLHQKHVKQCRMLRVAIDPKKPKFSCKECNKKFRFKTRFQLHVENVHSKLPDSLHCPKCPARCPDQAALDDHVATTHERQVFFCPHCGKEFARNSHVLRHMAQIGCDGKGPTVYNCEICNAEFSRKDNLMVHLRLQHITSKDFQCKQCSYSTGSFSKLIVHARNFHEEKPLRYECDHCGKVTSSRASMTKHLEIHGAKKFSCDVCQYTSFTVEVMSRHVLTHVRDKPYKCALCDSSFIQRSQLQRHTEKHDKNTCSVCAQMFRTHSGLLKHMSQHRVSANDLKVAKITLTCPYTECSQAQTEFATAIDLDKHIQQEHSERRPYKCEVCLKRFVSEVYMRRHVASHTLERARRCMYCVAARAYVRGMQLVRHVRAAHPNVFRDHLMHVRQVLNNPSTAERVNKSELESILNVLDAEASRILEGYGEGVLYGGMQETEPEPDPPPPKTESKPLMSEEELAASLGALLSRLIDKDMLECFGWPHECVDTVLENVIEHCGAKAADRGKWTRVQCLRENAKHLFLYVIEDKNITAMLTTKTIDQVVAHVLSSET